MDLLSRLGLGKRDPDDPLMRLLPQMPVPLSDAGPLAKGLAEDQTQTALERVRSRDDRELGGIAQYLLQLSVPRDGLAQRLAADQPCVWLLRQLVVLVVDEHAAARWLADRAVRFRDRSGREVDGAAYQQVEAIPLDGPGDEAQMLVAPNNKMGVQFVDTFLLLRRGRVFGSVDASTFKELDVRELVGELAGQLVSRIDALRRG